jgi:hypothetical protein
VPFKKKRKKNLISFEVRRKSQLSVVSRGSPVQLNTNEADCILSHPALSVSVAGLWRQTWTRVVTCYSPCDFQFVFKCGPACCVFRSCLLCVSVLLAVCFCPACCVFLSCLLCVSVLLAVCFGPACCVFLSCLLCVSVLLAVCFGHPRDTTDSCYALTFSFSQCVLHGLQLHLLKNRLKCAEFCVFISSILYYLLFRCIYCTITDVSFICVCLSAISHCPFLSCQQNAMRFDRLQHTTQHKFPALTLNNSLSLH